MTLRPKDPKEAWKRQREWRRRSVEKYEDRLREEHDSKFRSIGHNPERKRRRYERDFGEKADMIRDQTCDTCGAPPPSDPSHHPSRAAGGTSKNMLPMCRECHDAMHRKGVDTFLQERGFNRSWLEGRTGYWERRWRERER